MCWLCDVRGVINLALGMMVSHGDCVCDNEYPLCSWRSGSCATSSGERPSLSACGGYNGEYCSYSNAYAWPWFVVAMVAVTNFQMVKQVEKDIIMWWNALVELKEALLHDLRQHAEARRLTEEWKRIFEGPPPIAGAEQPGYEFYLLGIGIVAIGFALTFV